MNDKRCVKPMNEPREQKRPMLRRMRVGREPPKLGLLNFGKVPMRKTVVPRVLQLEQIKALEPNERRQAEQRVDNELNIVLKMTNNARKAKYGTDDMKIIHANLFNAERKKIISMREKKMKAPECPRPAPMTKVVSPQQLIREFLRNSPVQIIRPKKTISEMMREKNPEPPKMPKIPQCGVHGRIAKKAGMKIAKQVKEIKKKPPVEPYDKKRCSKKTSNKPYTVSELRRIAKGMSIPKGKIADAKSSVRKLCELIEAKVNTPKKGNESMKRRIEHAKKVLQYKIVSPKMDGTPWMMKSAQSRKLHAQANDDIYKKSLNELKKDDPVMFLKQKGYNAGKIGRKTKAVPEPYRQNNLLKIATELNINIPTTSKKPKPTATEIIALIKKKLEKA